MEIAEYHHVQDRILPKPPLLILLNSRHRNTRVQSLDLEPSGPSPFINPSDPTGAIVHSMIMDTDNSEDPVAETSSYKQYRGRTNTKGISFRNSLKAILPFPCLRVSQTLNSMQHCGAENHIDNESVVEPTVGRKSQVVMLTFKLFRVSAGRPLEGVRYSGNREIVIARLKHEEDFTGTTSHLCNGMGILIRVLHLRQTTFLRGYAEHSSETPRELFCTINTQTNQMDVHHCNSLTAAMRERREGSAHFSYFLRASLQS